MSASRFAHDPEKVFPDHAHAPGYEPTRRVELDDLPPEPIFEGGQIWRFILAIGLVAGAVGLLSLVF
jgi:hypothetical protein